MTGNSNTADDGGEGLVPEPFAGYRKPALWRTTPQLVPPPVAAVDPRETDVPAGILNYWNILVKWRWMIAACLVLGIATGLVSTFTTTPVYRATATIQIDLEPAKVKALQ